VLHPVHETPHADRLAASTPGYNDEVVAPSGRIRAAYRPIVTRLARLGPDGLADQAREIDRRRGEQGITFTADVAGEPVEQPFPFDPVPRLLDRAEWDALAAGLVQRHRALNAFLIDVYGPGRILADGVVPESVVQSCPGYRPEVEHPGPVDGQDGPPPVVVAGFDLLLGPDGWVVLEDNLRVPSGMAYAIANRRTTLAALPLLRDGLTGALDPEEAPGRLLRRLRSAAPPRCPREEPVVVLLSDGPDNSAWFEHRTLAAAMGIAVVTPPDLVADRDGVAARLDGVTVAVDVIYRRVDEEDLGEELEGLLRRATREGTVTFANALGNGVADDKAIYSYVPGMIREYLGEEPLLPQVETWVLADPAHYREVRGRLAELVVKPVDGYGGAGVVFGPTLDADGLAELEALVDATPERFVAQRPVLFSTHPTVSGGSLQPRHVDLRVFTLAGRDGVEAAPCPLTRVALEEGSLVVNSSRGGGSKDTWVTP
jgi:carboxylate-amine ligase